MSRWQWPNASNQALILSSISQFVGEMQLTVIDDPVAGVLWTLNSMTKVASRVAMPAAADDPSSPAAVAAGSRSEDLDTREIAGLVAQGT